MKDATAGFYWFSRGRDFVRAAKNMIRKDSRVDGKYYICPAFNELVLENLSIGVHKIDSKLYHPLKTERQVEQFETLFEKRIKRMKSFHLDDMVKGWFVGGFSPVAYSTSECEVAIKRYKSGDYESAHHHRVATEITVVISGQIRMVGKEWIAGDIIVLDPGTVTDFEALTDTVSVVVKVPSAPKDKYLNS